MIDSFIAIWLHTLEPTDAQAAAMARATKVPLSLQEARDHVVSARVMAALTGVEPETLLAIAWHESRFQAHTVTREPGHRVSCGVMTPVPKDRCLPEELTLGGGYLAGAEHLRSYLTRERSLGRALVAYAGGHGSVTHPKAGWRAWRAKNQFLEMRGRVRRALRRRG